jgi:hypothetical protein
MLHRPPLVAACLGALGLAPPAAAEIERLPLSGMPAFVVDVPADWSAKHDDTGDLLLVPNDSSGLVLLTIVELPDGDTGTLPAFAAQTLKAAGAAPCTRTEPASIAGESGEAFYSTLPEEGVTMALRLVAVRLVAVRLDATHVAAEVVARNPGLSAPQSRSIDDVVARIHFAD